MLQASTTPIIYMYLYLTCNICLCVPSSLPPQRRPSLLGTHRPVTLTVCRSSSLRKGSGEDDRKTYLRSRNSATRLSQCLDRQRSHSLDQLLYDNSKSHQCLYSCECELLLEFGCIYMYMNITTRLANLYNTTP